MEDREVRRRPGGRSARVAAAVHEAVDALLVEAGPGGFTVADVARRAGVNPTSIYRRWGSVEAVILDVEAARLTESSPLPDTGTLRGDLLAYARTAAADIAQPGRLAFLQALIGARELSDEQRSAPLLQRAAQFQAMLDRARDRGEPALDFTAIVDCILAPIYLRHLLGLGTDAADFDVFVERTLASTLR
ncbi:TetR/AcrR family transcriptional regulator [Mycolicibacterium fluoranthenivorans]|uniref:TetR/AcrR family transcriptional regulator n=1 Tax=Mycolicibacterium fluoranthenivorans TaxID=258505 RepID=A0A7G8PNZ4_9MYCO|nr:TetR/AcrR family transcriptional regulator [Mycobacterium hackensackense]QNJ96060.1 TetR/AcrR family transcriptional regulator [Mycolicibacterium fluoranthenivorans]